MFKQKENTTEQLIEEKIQKLPEVVRDVIVNSDWRDTLKKIIDNNNLLIDQGLSIEKETLIMMLGLDDPENYTKNIKREAGLDNNQAIKIAKEVDEKILKEMKKRIIEESYKEAGRKENKIDDLLGYREELEESLPSIRTDIVEEEDEDRNQIVSELEKDITIDDGPEEEPEEDAYNYKPRPELDPDLIPQADKEKSRLEMVEQEAAKEEPKKEDLWKEAAKNYKPRADLDPDLIPKADKRTSRIELSGDEIQNNNTIEYEKMEEEGPLPDLTPLRTLERDTDTLKGRPHRKSDVIERLDEKDPLIKKVEKKEEPKKEGEKEEDQKNETLEKTEVPTINEVEPESTQITTPPNEQESEPAEQKEVTFVPENIPTEEIEKIEETEEEREITQPKVEEDDLAIRPKQLETPEDPPAQVEQPQIEQTQTEQPQPEIPQEPELNKQTNQAPPEPQTPPKPQETSGSDPYREPIE